VLPCSSYFFCFLSNSNRRAAGSCGATITAQSRKSGLRHQNWQRPETAEAKTGDLAGVAVYRFGHMGALYLLAYEPDEKAEVIYIYAVGGRENFYRDLKAYLKS